MKKPIESASFIPPSLSRLFQEYDFHEMNILTHANIIIERTLEYGTWEELHWLLHTYGIKRVREYLQQLGQKRLSKVTLHYWCKLLQVDKVDSAPWAEIKKDLWTR